MTVNLNIIEINVYLFQVRGERMFSEYFDSYGGAIQYADEAITVVLIIVAAFIIYKVVTLLTRKIYKAVEDEDPTKTSEREQRAKTLVSIFKHVAFIFIAFVAFMFVLRQMGLDITPILASAGIVGLAVGFGAQSLVRDVITGFFLLLENQFAVGDVVEINGKTGLVEKMTLRVTAIRGGDGSLHYIPNGEITVVSNMTKDWSRVNIELRVNYDEDVDRVMDVATVVCAELAADEEYVDKLLGEPSVLGLDSIDDFSISIRILVKTKPSEQWSVARELRRRIKKRFDEEKIRMPRPLFQQVGTFE